MSKDVRPIVYIDENVTSVGEARLKAEKAEKLREIIKQNIWGLIVSTPKDITPNDEEPIHYLEREFETLWEDLWDAFIDDYKYSIVADDAQYDKDSLVQKKWDEEIRSEKELLEKSQRRKEWMKKYGLNEYNFDDMEIYEYCKSENIEITEPFTEETRGEMLKTIKEEEQTIFKEALERLKKD